jgi:TPR repeat protein
VGQHGEELSRLLRSKAQLTREPGPCPIPDTLFWFVNGGSVCLGWARSVGFWTLPEDTALHGPSLLIIALAVAILTPPASASNPSAGSSQSLDAAILAYQTQQYTTALKLFEAAAQKGNPEAQYTLGFMYRDGRGTRRDDSKAMAWYRKAAEQGYAPAEYNLGLMYAQGDGTKADPAAAQRWFRRAADHGSVEARVKLGEIAVLEEQFEEAFLWFSKAADQDDADAAFNVGSLYYVGRGAPKDEAKATEYYRKAARLGMIEAKDVLKSLGQDPD